ncbi:TauD/TfdA family dioxygenase [Microbispora bryophytorum]|uniref:TauD/TfdA family dioxygenase n=1 Tax=Microbispora bryophytorum TaxID=1460882 RepID=UPI0033EE258B
MKDLERILRDRGFAYLDEQTDHDAREVARRLGRSSMSHELKPRKQAAADPWSLSGVYGLGPFPWHTDGAISSDPPRWVLLRAVRVSEGTWTELLEPDVEVQTAMRRTVLRATDRTGRIRHLPAAVPDGDRWRLRWDPRTCAPRTGLTIDEMQRQSCTETVTWAEGRLLIIDNSRLLHRRPAVDERAERLLERIYVWGE